MMNMTIEEQKHTIFDKEIRDNYKRIDRMFAYLMIFQWAGAIILALVVAPRTWAGIESEPHIHLYAALILGGLLTAMPVFLAFKKGGQAITRYTIAVCQILFSALLIHLTGGRIETHFHLFGTFAFFAFYKDWKVIVIGTLVAAVDHAVRGIFWPQSIFGVITASEWRVVEHAAWLLLEAVVLLRGSMIQRNDVEVLAEKQAMAEHARKEGEQLMEDLQRQKANAENQRQQLQVAMEKDAQEHEYLQRCVTKLLQSMDEFTRGNLDIHLEAERNDEMGRLTNGLNNMVGTFRGILDGVTTMIDKSTGVSEQLASMAEVMSSSVSAQLKESESISGVLNRIAGDSLKNAEEAEESAQMMNENGEYAKNGEAIVRKTVTKIQEIAEVVEQSVDTISNLGKTSERIGEINVVINEIADQTNLLALNAAIEAARAGEQGRGFAVVADEVRKLAERTSNATGEIGAIIKSIQRETENAIKAINRGNEEVREGITLGEGASDALKKIMDSTYNMQIKINAIQESNARQARDSTQITEGTSRIAEHTNKDAETVSTIVEMFGELQEAMNKLSNIVVRFKEGRTKNTVDTF